VLITANYPGTFHRLPCAIWFSFSCSSSRSCNFGARLETTHLTYWYQFAWPWLLYLPPLRFLIPLNRGQSHLATTWAIAICASVTIRNESAVCKPRSSQNLLKHKPDPYVCCIRFPTARNDCHSRAAHLFMKCRKWRVRTC
jgi:hypothetical protein